MTQIARWQRAPGRIISGIYRIHDIRPGFWHTPERPSTRIRIADATGTADCLVKWPPAMVRAILGENSSLARLKGRLAEPSSAPPRLMATELARADGGEGPSWQFLSPSWVPDTAAQAFARLIQVLDRFKHGPLRVLMDSVFADSTIAEPFLSAPASRDHHHASAGGLLIHSVECAEAADALAPLLLDADERPLAIVGALLHDIAKVRMYRVAGSAAQPIRGVSQEALNLEVLAPHLAVLDRVWPAGGSALREILAPSRSCAGRSSWAPLLLTDFVRNIDRLSAGADVRRQCFTRAPDWQRYIRTKHGQLLARVAPRDGLDASTAKSVMP